MFQSALARLVISPPLSLNGFSAENQAREEGTVSLLYGEGCVVWLVVNMVRCICGELCVCSASSSTPLQRAPAKDEYVHVRSCEESKVPAHARPCSFIREQDSVHARV